MNIIISILLAVLVAYALKKRNAAGELAWWRLVAALFAGAFPHIQILAFFFGQAAYEKHLFAETYSLFLLPLWALGLAWLVGKISKRDWKRFYLITFSGLAVSILFTLFSTEGVRLFAPAFKWRASLNLMYSFDFIILVIASITVAFTMVVRAWRRDIARVGCSVILLYLVALITFQQKATSFAHDYIDALSLDAKRVYVLAQPVSPLNWRVVVRTQDDRLHDTRIHLFRKKKLKTDDTSTRAWRVFSTYAPMDQATWGIYRRIGRTTNGANIELRDTWNRLRKSHYNWHLRFAVFRKYIDMNGTRCVKWRDLRRFGTKNKNIGVYVSCKNGKKIDLYQADRAGSLSKLERIY